MHRQTDFAGSPKDAAAIFQSNDLGMIAIHPLASTRGFESIVRKSGYRFFPNRRCVFKNMEHDA